MWPPPLGRRLGRRPWRVCLGPGSAGAAPLANTAQAGRPPRPAYHCTWERTCKRAAGRGPPQMRQGIASHQGWLKPIRGGGACFEQTSPVTLFTKASEHTMNVLHSTMGNARRARVWIMFSAVLACLAHGTSALDFKIIGGTCNNTPPSSVTKLQAQASFARGRELWARHAFCTCPLLRLAAAHASAACECPPA